MSKDSDGTLSLARRRAQRQGRKRACPVCGKPTAAPFAPFCSARCKQVDLGRWLSGTYRVETDEQPEGPAAPKSDDPASGD